MRGQHIHRGLFARKVGSLHVASIPLDDAFVTIAHDDDSGDSGVTRSADTASGTVKCAAG